MVESLLLISATLAPPFSIYQLWHQIHSVQRPEKPLSLNNIKVFQILNGLLVTFNISKETTYKFLLSFFSKRCWAMRINASIKYNVGYFSPSKSLGQQIVRQKSRALRRRDTNHNSKVIKGASFRPFSLTATFPRRREILVTKRECAPSQMSY